MKKSRVSQTIPKRMARAKKRGLSYREYMMQAHKKRLQRRKTTPPSRHIAPEPYQGVFRKGSSMVGSPKRGSQLLTFMPTTKMQAHGLKLTSLRFFTPKKARLMGLETRRDWINEMVRDLKSKGLL